MKNDHIELTQQLILDEINITIVFLYNFVKKIGVTIYFKSKQGSLSKLVCRSTTTTNFLLCHFLVMLRFLPRFLRPFKSVRGAGDDNSGKIIYSSVFVSKLINDTKYNL